MINLPAQVNLVPSRYFKISVLAFVFWLPLSQFTGVNQSHKNTPAVKPPNSLTAVSDKKTHEVFGFAPFWTLDKLDNIDFDTLTTLAYFSVPVLGNGDLDHSDQGYITFQTPKATSIFQKAHDNGTRVVLTLTQMNNQPILALLDNSQAEGNAINQAVNLVQSRGLDGINIDFEFNGDPGELYRNKFTDFVRQLADEMHKVNPNSKVTVSVYAVSVKEPKIYDVGKLSQISDGIFMMAYDFANASSSAAMPTAPLYGASDGTYWYDVSTAVDDFLQVMPASKLILGLPWYGYNYAVYQPVVKAVTGWRTGIAEPYSVAQDNIKSDLEGWDNKGQVGWKAYLSWNTWRMIFLEDSRSLSLKYDFAKSKDLGGIGIWALGFDAGKKELWQTIKDKFGIKTADSSVLARAVKEVPVNYD